MNDQALDFEVSVTFACPYCQDEIDRPWERDTTWISCEVCGEAINLDSQRALARAYTHYQFAADLTAPELHSARMRPTQFSPEAKDALRSYQRSYTGVQVALRARLPEEQEARAIEMMAEISQLLLRNQMIGALEAKFWTQLMVYHTARTEYRELAEKLAEPAGLLTRLFRSPSWRLRRLQLKRALARREETLQILERTLTFVEPIQTRRGLPT